MIGRALVGLDFRGEYHLSGPVADWLPISIFLLGFGSVAFVLVEWLAPWRYRLRREHGESELAQTLVTTWGTDTLAPFALRADKSYFFSDDRSAFLAYRVTGGVAIVAGDPIGRAEAREDLVRRFLAFAHEREWRVAVLGVSEECLGSLPRARPSLPVSRRRGGGGHRIVQPGGPRDPQGAAIGASSAAGGV